MDNAQLQQEIELVQRDVSRMQQELGVLGVAARSEPTLRAPMRPSSRNAIWSIISYPVSISLANTTPQTAANFSTFFVADRPYSVLSVTEVHGTAGSDASAVTLQIERLQGTEALDAGDELLTTTINLKGTANTVQYGTLKSTEVTTLYRGDRLALKDAGTLTALKDVTVTVLLLPQ